MSPSLFPMQRGTVPIVREAGRAPGQFWMGAENLAPTGIRSKDRPVRIATLYGLHIPAQAGEFKRN
jgi:hypothetical protein